MMSKLPLKRTGNKVKGKALNKGKKRRAALQQTEPFKRNKDNQTEMQP